MPEKALGARSSVEPKTNLQSQNSESPALYPFHVKQPLFLMTITQFLNLTTAPACNSQNHVSMTTPCAPPSVHLDFLFLLVLRAPLTPS